MKNIVVGCLLFLLCAVNTSLAVKSADSKIPEESESKIVYIEQDKELLEYQLEQYELSTNTNHWVAKQKAYSISLSASLQEYTIKVCKQYNIEPSLALAVMEVESNYTADKIGDSGRSLGMMQIQPRWHKARMERLGVDDLLDAEQNILTGIDILSELINKYGDAEYALMCYNAGEGKAQKNKAKGVTQTNYTKEVLEAKERIELKFNNDTQTSERNKWSGVQATIQ